ncbi:MAG TPA: hypothetical protein VFJ57_08740 [Solirubrobacterales bacterium]|nr:hypothetical protein [Solirubrobacterales bacterium]
MRRLLTLAGLFAALAALAGCGGSDSDSTAAETATGGTSEALTKAEFIEQADAICEDHASEREELQEQAAELAEEVNAGSDQAREELADLLAEAAGSAEAEYGELQDLTPPPSDASLIGNMLSTADDQVGLTEEAVDALREKDYKTFSALTVETGKLKAKATAIAVAYGLEVCGTEGE